MKYLFSERNERSERGEETHLAMSQKYGLVSDKHFSEHRMLSETYAGGKLCYEDDIVLNRLKAHLGVFALASQKGVISPDYTVLKPVAEIILPRYAEYYLKSDVCRYELRIRVRGVVEGFWRLYTEDFNTIKMPLPSFPEQDQIVRYLDWKVSQINKLINAKRRQIALLQEQKRVTISTAIPQSGEQVRFRHLFTLVKGLSITKSNLSESGIPCMNYGQIHSKCGFEVDPGIHQLPFVAENYLDTNPKSLMHYGDFVFADTSEDLAGSENFSFLNSQTPVFAGYHTIIARPQGMCNYRYLAYFFDSPQFRSQIQQRVNGVKVYSITRTILNDTLIILTDGEEQKRVVQLLDKQCHDFVRLAEKINVEISLLHECRTRLISDVVTGKLDVRGFVVPEYEAVEDVAGDEDVEDTEDTEGAE